MTAKTKRRLRVLAAVAAVAAAAALVAVLHLRRAADARRLAEVVAALDAIDPHWRLDDLVADLRTTPLPDDENLAGALAAARAALGPHDWRTQERNALLAGLSANVRLSRPQWRFVIAGVELHEDAILPALEFERFPRGRHATTYADDGLSTAYRPIEAIANLHNRLLTDFALAAVQRGDATTTLRLIRGDLNRGRSFRDEPLKPSQLWRARCRKDAVRTLERLLGHVALTDAQLAELQRELTAELADDPALLAARGELARADRVVELIRRGAWRASMLRRVCEPTGAAATRLEGVRDWFIDLIGTDTTAAHAAALDRESRVLDAVRRPWPERWRAVQALDGPRHWNRTKLGDWVLLSFPSFALDEARVRCALAAVAVERHRLAHGGWPAALAEVGPLPGDPFAAGPLGYRRTGDGVEVFVAVPDLDDAGDGFVDPPAGGRPPHAAVGFRLWDVPHRNRPPGDAP